MYIVVHIACDFVNRCHFVCNKAYESICQKGSICAWDIYGRGISDHISYIGRNGIYQVGSDAFAAYERGGSGDDIGI